MGSALFCLLILKMGPVLSGEANGLHLFSALTEERDRNTGAFLLARKQHSLCIYWKEALAAPLLSLCVIDIGSCEAALHRTAIVDGERGRQRPRRTAYVPDQDVSNPAHGNQ